MRIKPIGARKEIRLHKNYGEPWAPARPAKKSKIEVGLSSFIRHSSFGFRHSPMKRVYTRMMEIRCQRSDVSGQWSVMPAARLLEDSFQLLADGAVTQPRDRWRCGGR